MTSTITLSDSEIVDVMNGLEPADKEVRDAILRTPLGHLCYDRRYLTAIPQVPLGYWQHTYQTGVSRDIRVGEEISESDLLSGDMLSPYRERGLHTVILYKAGDRTVAVEEIIEEPGNLNDLRCGAQTGARSLMKLAARLGGLPPTSVDSMRGRSCWIGR